MPRKSLDRPKILESIVAQLSREGPMPSAVLRQAVGVSHATLARLIKELQGTVIAIGNGRATTYAASRSVADLPKVFTLYEVLENGGSRTLGHIYLVRPRGYFVTSACKDIDGGHVTDLPYVLSDLYPSGFLGRLLPKLHQDLGFPDDIRIWNGDTTLRYLSLRGWNPIGSVIVGEQGLREHIAERIKVPLDAVDHKDVVKEYPRRAREILKLGVPGSSAAGEQPKFLATRFPERLPVLIKFSPPLVDALSVRIGDLLIAEHLALQTLRDFGQEAARSQIILAEERIFLEVERFDRTPHGGRRGVITLLSLDNHFVGGLGNWSESVMALANLGIVPKSAIQKTLWLETFSQLIANTDRHFGNLSFLARGGRILSLAPAYDISPMLYAPVASQLIDQVFNPPYPDPRLGKSYAVVCQAAISFWGRVAKDARISSGFRAISRDNEAKVKEFSELSARLPQ